MIVITKVRKLIGALTSYGSVAEKPVLSFGVGQLDLIAEHKARAKFCLSQWPLNFIFQGGRPVAPLAQDMPCLIADVSSPFGQFGVPANDPEAYYLLGDPVIGQWIRWDEQATSVLPAAIVRMIHST